MSEAVQETVEPVDETEPITDPEPTPEEEEAAEEKETPPEPEPPEQPAGLTPEQLDKRSKTVTRAFEAYTRKLQDAYAEDALTLMPCPLCSFTETQGWVDARDAGHVPEDVVKVALTFLGRAVAVEYKKSPYHTRCRICDGLGKLATDSLVPGQETLPCKNCNGFGFTSPEGVTPPMAVVPTFVNPSDNGEHAPAQLQDADNWNQPRLLPDGRENPNYGKQPNYWVSVEPWGDTRGLTGADA